LFLVFVICLQVFMNVGIGVYYHLNKAYIVQKLCENRSNPKLHCNGHCYLTRELKKAEEGKSKSSQLIKEKEEVVVNQIPLLSGKYLPGLVITKIIVTNSVLPFSGNIRSILKPPVV